MKLATVKGRFLAVLADSVNDPDTAPEQIPMSGTVILTPSVPAILDTSGEVPATLLPTPITAILDEQGDISLNGAKGVQLAATTGEGINPSGWTYRVAFNLQVGKLKIAYASYDIQLPPDEVTDLTLVAKVPTSTGVGLTRGVGIQSVTAAGGTLTFRLTDATTQNVAIDGALVTSISGMSGAVSQAQLDAEIAGLVTDPAKQAGSAVKTIAAAESPDPRSQPWDIVIVAGQSNSWETDYPSFYDTEPDNRVLQWNATTGAAEVVPTKNDELGFAFARHYARTHLARGRKVVKTRNGFGETGFSSTSISPAPAGYATAPNGTWDRHLTADPLNRFHEMIRTGKDILASAPAGSRIVALLWSQGEQDRAKVAAEGPAWYETRLDDLISKAREEWALPELPVIILSQTPETIAGSLGGGLVNRAHEDTPRRVLRTSYVYGPEGYSKANEDIHFSYAAHDIRGRLAVSALPKARMNKSVIRPGTPQALSVRVVGEIAQAQWAAPIQRATSYTLEHSTDEGATWHPVVLGHPMALSAKWAVPLGAPVWARIRSANEFSEPSLWSPTAAAYGSTPAPTRNMTAPAPLKVSDYTNRWVASGQPDGPVAALTPATGTAPFTQSTSFTKRPTVVGNPVKSVRFDGIDDDMLVPVAAKTVTLVARVKSAVGVNTALFSTGPNAVRRTNEATPRIATQIGAAATQYHSYAEGTDFHVFTFIADGTTGALSIDGGYTALNAATANTQILLGRYGTTNYGNIEVLDVLAWDRALTAVECASVYASLKAQHIDSPIPAVVTTPSAGKFGVSDFVNSWWCAPRSIYHDLRKTVYQGGVDANGEIEIARIDLRRKQSTKIKLGLYEVDDHNVPAFLIEDDKPPIVAIVRHAVESVVRVRIGKARHDIESLETATEQLVAFPGACTYAHLHRRPGTNTVALLTRNQDGWYVRVSNDWGATWGTATRIFGKAYATFKVHNGVAHYAITDHPTTGVNVNTLYFRISLETGVITNAAGLTLGNLWNLTSVLSLNDMTRARQSFDSDDRHNSTRVFDLLPDGSILAMRMLKSAPELGGEYGVYRYSTHSGSGSYSGEKDGALRGWTWEPLVASGVPVGYYQSAYVGGMTGGANSNEVYLCREENGTWTTERWTKSNGTWSKVETLQSFSDGTKLGRPQVPWGAYGTGLYVGLEYHRYLTTAYHGYYGDQVVLETGVKSSLPFVDTTPPLPPLSPKVVPGNTGADLSWTANTDAAEVSAYEIYDSFDARIGTTSSTSFTVVNLAAGQSYTYRVRAVDAAGNKSPFAAFPSFQTTAPLTRDPILVDRGSLALIDPTNQFGAWSAGVPADGATVTNLARSEFSTLAGLTPEATDFTVVNSLTASDGVTQRTTKGGLHTVISQSTATINRHYALLSDNLRAYMAANPGNAYYVSSWLTVTRHYAEGTVPATTGRFVGYLTSGFSDTQNVRLVTGSKLSVTPSTNRTAIQESATPAPLDTPHLIAGAHSSINTPGTDQKFVYMGTGQTASLTNKTASWILYRVYVEDLTVSGRSYAQVNALDQAEYDKAFGAGGRFAGDTYSSPAAVLA